MRAVAAQPNNGFFGDVNVKNTAQWAGVAAAVPGTVVTLAAGSAYLYKKSHPEAVTPGLRDLISAGPRVAGAAALLATEGLIIKQLDWPDGEKGYYSALAGGAVFGAVTGAGLTALASPSLILREPKLFGALTLGAATAGAVVGGGIGAARALFGKGDN